MNATQAENLRILIRHMEANVTAPLAMRSVFRERLGCIALTPAEGAACGTPGCAMGEAVMVPALRAQMNPVIVVGAQACYEYADTLFGSGPRLFGYELDNAWGRDTVTPQEWVVEARKVLAESGYSMEPQDDGFAAFMDKVQMPVVLPEFFPRVGNHLEEKT